MLLVTHTATGILISQNIKSKLGCFLLGIILHYLMDIIPHGDEVMNRWRGENKMKRVYSVIISDFFLSVILALFFYFKKSYISSSYFYAISGSILPDILFLGYEYSKNWIKKPSFLSWFLASTKIYPLFKEIALLNKKAHHIFKWDIPFGWANIIQIILIIFLIKNLL